MTNKGKKRPLHFNTDRGSVTDYRDGLTNEKVAELCALLMNAEDEAVARFVEKVRVAVSFYEAHQRARSTCLDAKDQERYLKKLESKIERLDKLTYELSDLLVDAPFELRQRARAAGTPIEAVQAVLNNMMLAISDIDPGKSKQRPETVPAILAIAEAYREQLGTEPVVRAYRTKDDVIRGASVADQFVPVVATLLNLSVDHVYRLAEKILPS